MKYSIAAVGLCVFLLGSAPAKHEFYVSITELNKVQDTLQVAIRIFTSDFEHTLEEETGEKIYLDKTLDKQVFPAMTAYLEKHFKIGVAGKDCLLKWIGFENADDVTWVYAETILPPEPRTIFIRNSLLLEYYPNQQNLVHLRTGEGFESQLCTRDQPEARFLVAQ